MKNFSVLFIIISAFSCTGMEIIDEAFEAVKSGNIEQLNQFLDTGLSPNAEKNERSLLQAASQNDSIAICRLLIERGAQINYRSNADSITALRNAICREDLALTLELLLSAANVNLKNSTGYSALDSAIEKHDRIIIFTLIAAGAIPKRNVFNFFKEQPLIILLLMNRRKAVPAQLESFNTWCGKDGLNKLDVKHVCYALLVALAQGSAQQIVRKIIDVLDLSKVNIKRLLEQALSFAVGNSNYTEIEYILRLLWERDESDPLYLGNLLKRCITENNKEVFDQLLKGGASTVAAIISMHNENFTSHLPSDVKEYYKKALYEMSLYTDHSMVQRALM